MEWKPGRKGGGEGWEAGVLKGWEMGEVRGNCTKNAPHFGIEKGLKD